MKDVIRSLVVATFCVVAWAGSAGAQGSAATAPGAANTAPEVQQPAPGVAQGSNDGAQPAASAAGSAAPATAAGSAAPAAAGSAAPAAGAGSAAAAPSGVKAWYDAEADKEIEEEGTFWMPKAVNKAADESDIMFYSVLALSVFFFFAIAIAVVYLTVKYRHRPGHKPQPSAAHNDAMEITWTVIPTIICVFLFYYGWNTYVRVVTPPTKAVEINLLAMRWNWQFTHSNGVQDSDLHVPVNTPVRLVMTSKDVIHSFYAPVMRVKQDILPRRYTYAWFFPTKPGTYRLTCAEYCGTNHSQMGITNDGRRAVLVVHEPGGYERYLADKAALSTALPHEQLGKLLYEKKGCNACHTTDGTPRVGPSWKGTFGTMVPLTDGGSVKMDEDYIRESIFKPQAKARPGFPPSMPSFEGQLKDREIEGLIAFIKSLK
jgi:cytochrome c oxidase subunit II